MSDNFYTFGGAYFWEDVFFYQKWRIQRNYVTKKCRLLDNWDISRFEGSFDDCRKAFIKYIEVYEIARQKGHMVIMIPGLAESKNIFKPLWRAVIKEGLMAAAINYPSTQKGIDGHVRQLDFFLNHLEDVNEISFVTKGIGSILLKKLFMLDTQWRQKLKVNKVVEVVPLNHGSRLLKFLSKFKFFNFILGPVIEELEPKKIEKLPPVPKDIPTGIILCESKITRFFEKIFDKKMPILSPDEEKSFEKAKDVKEIETLKFNLFKDERIINAVVSFLKKGKF